MAIDVNKACSGCRACVEICPFKAISMVEDSETFLYPTIDASKCKECGLCEKVCPNKNDCFCGSEVEAFVGFHKDADVVDKSTSGGAFSAICEVFVPKGYIVYGAAFKNHFEVVHLAAETYEECFKFRKSKYVQSNTNGCYSKIAEQLKNGKKVLFSGVSCQCAALRSFLKIKGIDATGLIVVGLPCSGTPSQKMFDLYIADLEKKENSKIVEYRFRNRENKKGVIDPRTAYIRFESGTEQIKSKKNDPYLRGFYKRLTIRPSCNTCKFATRDRVADISISDAWKIETIHPEYDSHAGCSLILIGNKAIPFRDEIVDKMSLTKIDSEWAFSSQGIFSRPVPKNENRYKFYETWQREGFERAVFANTKDSIKGSKGFIFLAHLLSRETKDSLKKWFRAFGIKM